MECPDCGHDMIGPHMFGEYLCAKCGYIMWEDDGLQEADAMHLRRLPSRGRL